MNLLFFQNKPPNFRFVESQKISEQLEKFLSQNSGKYRTHLVEVYKLNNEACLF